MIRGDVEEKSRKLSLQDCEFPREVKEEHQTQALQSQYISHYSLSAEIGIYV